MGLGRRFAGLGQPWRSRHALLVIPLVLIVVITVVDLHAPADVHLGPALVIAPAITASFAGPRLTGAMAVLALAAQVIIGVFHGGLTTTNHLVQIVTLAVLSVLVVCFCLVRERRERQLAKVRSVSEAAQHVLLWPLPEQIGPLQISCLYLAAEEEARIGGDLYAATRTEDGVRVMIGDVRGKGLPAVGEAAILLGAFREAAHQHTNLPALAAALEHSISRYQAEFATPDGDVGEHFATVLLLEIPDGSSATQMISCGHPPPLLLTPDHSVSPLSLHPSPPLGVAETTAADHSPDVVAFQAGDTLLLYTDGVIEARDHDGDFYPLAERTARWTDSSPDVLLHHVRRDLLAHVGGRLDDDAALVAIHRPPTPHPGHRLGKAVHTGDSRH
ncbi:PP2C family protein-serine/threonine phosphatase [Kitasatospora sp. NPDC018058]|uniref:PP2C family protein-serine/threonine phosphatase n=1 Tax=Kitasatospora sp. NPDC018058 TaxID=3364025 RepID=UPI0037C146D1